MASPFLVAFTESVVLTLVQRGQLVLCGEQVVVVRYVAERLGEAGQGRSLITTLAAALVACPQVEELFASDEVLKDLVTEMPRRALGREP